MVISTTLREDMVIRTENMVVSSGGNVYSTMTFPLNPNVNIQAMQMKALYDLESKVLPNTLKTHTFKWDSRHEDWLPVFNDFWKPSKGGTPSVDEIWKEHSNGIGGHLSITQLKSIWGGRWKCNQKKIKTESARCSKVVELITCLSEQPGWDANRALKFLCNHHEISSSSSVGHLTSRTYALLMNTYKRISMQLIVL